MPVLDQELVSLIKRDDDEIAQALKGYATEPLQKLRNRLAVPIKLGWLQNTFVKSFGIDMAGEQNHFVGLIDAELTGRDSK